VTLLLEIQYASNLMEAVTPGRDGEAFPMEAVTPGRDGEAFPMEAVTPGRDGEVFPMEAVTPGRDGEASPVAVSSRWGGLFHGRLWERWVSESGELTGLPSPTAEGSEAGIARTRRATLTSVLSTCTRDPSPSPHPRAIAALSCENRGQRPSRMGRVGPRGRWPSTSRASGTAAPPECCAW
jgi:hypothetical protein